MTSHNSQKPKTWRIQSNTFFLTYKTHLSENFIKILIEQVDNLCPGALLDCWILGREQADDQDPYDHTHIFFRSTKKIDSTDPFMFDYYDSVKHKRKDGTYSHWIHPNIQSARNKNKCINYCKKEKNYDTNIVENEDRSNIYDRILSAPTCIDAIRNNANELRDVVSIKALYELKGICIDAKYLEKLKNIKLQPWQSNLIKMTRSTFGDRRSIYWVYDPVGGVGKSTFCDYLQANNPDDTYVFTATGSLRDLGDVLRNWISNGNSPKHILIDLPRNCADKDSIYGFLECIKNGRVTCTKYKGTTLIFEPPSVIVFANWQPKVSQMSMDRWRIFKIDAQSKKLLPEPISSSSSKALRSDSSQDTTGDPLDETEDEDMTIDIND